MGFIIIFGRPGLPSVSRQMPTRNCGACSNERFVRNRTLHLRIIQMKVIVRWTCSQGGHGVDVRLVRFRRVLRAAHRTTRYQRFLENAGLATLEALASIDSVERTLERLPAIDLDEFCGLRATFESPGGTRPSPQSFRSPLEHTPKTAILMAGFQPSSGITAVRLTKTSPMTSAFLAEG